MRTLFVVAAALVVLPLTAAADPSPLRGSTLCAIASALGVSSTAIRGTQATVRASPAHTVYVAGLSGRYGGVGSPYTVAPRRLGFARVRFVSAGREGAALVDNRTGQVSGLRITGGRR
jgi:hypothetical protein